MAVACAFARGASGGSSMGDGPSVDEKEARIVDTGVKGVMSAMSVVDHG